jgi:site-specific recombinase XerD
MLCLTSIRRMEAVGLKLYDVDTERGALMVRLGKDRLLPIGARACAWIAKYRDEVCLDDAARPSTPGKLGELVVTSRSFDAALGA